MKTQKKMIDEEIVERIVAVGVVLLAASWMIYLIGKNE